MKKIGLISCSKSSADDVIAACSEYSFDYLGCEDINNSIQNYDLVTIDFDCIEENKLKDICRNIKDYSIPAIMIGKKMVLPDLKRFDPVFVFSSFNVIPLQHAFSRMFDVPSNESDEEVIKDTLTNGLFLKDGSKYKRIPYAKLLFLQADGNYVVLQLQDKKYVVRFSLRKSSGVLHSHSFIQVHRNFIVNFKLIDEVDIENNTLQLGAHTVPIGRAYKAKLKESLLALQ